MGTGKLPIRAMAAVKRYRELTWSATLLGTNAAVQRESRENPDVANELDGLVHARGELPDIPRGAAHVPLGDVVVVRRTHEEERAVLGVAALGDARECAPRDSLRASADTTVASAVSTRFSSSITS